MSTEYIYLRGVCKWAQVRKPDEKYQNFKVNLYLDKASEETFTKSGLRLEPNKDDDGTYYTFRRPVERLIKGEVVKFGPPKIFAADNTVLPEDVLIGNGSDVTIKVSVYDTVKGKGHRFEVLRVEKLIEFIPDGATNRDSFLPPNSAGPTTVAPPVTGPKTQSPRVPF